MWKLLMIMCVNAVITIALSSNIVSADAENEYVVFEHPTLDNFSPTHVPAAEAIVDTVSCELARGEYEPVQIGVHALADSLTDIRVTSIWTSR